MTIVVMFLWPLSEVVAFVCVVVGVPGIYTPYRFHMLSLSLSRLCSR